MKKFLLILIIGPALVGFSYAEDYYVFRVRAEDDKLMASFVTDKPDLPLWLTANGKKSYYVMYVSKPQFEAGWNALAQAVKDAGKDTAEDSNSYIDIDAQALIKVIAELTGTDVNTVKQKFKAAKKTKEKKK